MKQNQAWIRAGVLLLLLAICLLPSAAFGTEHVLKQGHKHVEVDIHKVPGKNANKVNKKKAGYYPSRYDPREDAAFTGSIKVKDQGYTNLCWAYSSTTAAEISWLNDNDNAAGTVEKLSPVQLAYFFYNRINDPLGNTKKDYNYAYSNWVDEGGSCVYTGLHLSTWSGFALETAAPLSASKATNQNYVYNTLPRKTYGKSLAYNKDALTLQNSTYYASCSVNTAKQVIMDYGAAVVSMEFDYDDFLNGDDETGIYYKPDAYDTNTHEVALVGWDDNYPKENFGSWNEETYEYDAQPSQDGAWIVLNSWGREWGDGGYLYVSYESDDILSDGILGLDMQEADTYDHNFQYDGNAYANNYGNLDEQPPYEMHAGEKAANVYVSDGTNSLEAVGLTEWNDGSTGYTIDIYTGLTDRSDPISGTLASTTNVWTQTPGYKTLPLHQPVLLHAGETYAIVVTCKTTTNMGIEADYYGYDAGLAKKQSLYSVGDGSWHDAAAEKYSLGKGFCFRIKGLANAVIQPTGLKSLKAGKKALTVKWKRQTQLLDGVPVDGYQIRCSLKSSMKNAKVVTVKGDRKTSKKVTKLKKKKKYYVQVRTYVKGSDGITYYSSWSAKKSKKTK